MFPDSKIASSLSRKHTKCKSIICDALDPHLKKPIVELSQSSPFNLLCDESNELGDSQKLLTILVRLFEPLNEVICTRHLDTVGITDLSAQGIYLAIKETLHKYHIPIENLLSFTSDTCNVMKGAKGGVIAKIQVEQPKVVDIKCVCHVVNLFVKSAVKVMPLKVDELLVDIFIIFATVLKELPL